MKRKKAVLGLILIALVSSQWLVPSHLWTVGMARPARAHAEHFTHGLSSSTVTPLPHSCCDEGARSAHEELCCCGACPALPSAIADFGSYIPYLFFRVVEPQEQSFISLASPWHPPTL